MASPQVEDGYTRIANELLEALARTRLPQYEMAIFLMIFRYTYGYGKKVARIPLDNLATGTGISKSNTCHAINNLTARNIIKRGDDGLGINKNYESWKVPDTKQPLQPAKKPKKTRKSTDPRVAEIIKHFYDVVLEKKGFKPVINGAKDGKVVKEALNSNGVTLEEAKDCISWYINTEKAKEHLTLSAALSAHSINQFRAASHREDWRNKIG